MVTTKEKNKETKKEAKRIALPVLDVSGNEVEKIELDPQVFDGRISHGSIYRAVHNYLRNQRSGTASTKTRGEVSGGGKKPWRQKGTGRARVGSIRSPLWRHGGVIFGPHPRDFSYSLPKKIKRLALRSILNDRAINNGMVVLNTLVLENSKTKTFAAILKNIKLNNKTLLVIDSFNENVSLSTRNIADLGLSYSSDVNTYDVLSFKKLLITKAALHRLTERLK